MAGPLISAIEFSAWAYSSRLLSICLERLGFDNKIAKKSNKIFKLHFYESLTLHLASKKLFCLVQ